MRVLLLNPNSYQDPPVIPIGLEYLLTYLRANGHESELLNLCFSGNREQDIEATLTNKKFDLIGVTIRNIETLDSPFNNVFFLDDIKKVVAHLKQYNIPIVLGGSGFSGMPDEILEYCNADFGIYGPGEQAILKLIDDIENERIDYRLLNGWDLPTKQELTHFRGKDVDYSKYKQVVGDDFRVGFETQKGCPNHCSYCIEAGNGLHPKSIANTITEIKHLVEQGYHNFFLCDAEFNLDLNHSINFCKALIKADLDMKWGLMMRPTPISEDLFKLLKESKVESIFCSCDSDKKEQNRANYTLEDIGKVIEYCRKSDLPISMGLLLGFPFEDKSSIEETINYLKEHRPDSVSINAYLRLYGNTSLSETIASSSQLHQYLSRSLKPEEDFLEPIFFTPIEVDYVQKLIEGDKMFEIMLS